MAHIEFTPHLRKHVDCPPVDVEAATLGEALARVFEQNPRLEGYIVDDQGCVRQHVAVFIDNVLLRDRQDLDVPLRPDSAVYVMQALSGG